MTQAIQTFLRLRPSCKQVLVTAQAQLSAHANRCFDNSMALCLANSQRYTLRSGWLAGENMKHLGTVFIPHYWVFNEKTSRHLDPTPRAPDDSQAYDYLQDMEILLQATAEHPLPVPVRLNALGDLEALVRGDTWQALQVLSTDMLFKLAQYLG